MVSESARKWSIQLCSAYFTELTKELVDRMDGDAFTIPSLAVLDMKANKLEAMQEVREAASA